MPETWSIVVALVQMLVTLVLGVLGYLLKRQIDQNDEKIDRMDRRLERLEDRGQEAATGSIVADGKIREGLAKEYVSQAACARCHDETRETTTRIFAKVEDLQKGQARIEGEMAGLTAAVKGLCEGIGRVAAQGGRDGQG